MRHPIGTRIRAARVLAGYKKPADLAKAIGGRGLGATKLYAIEQGKETVAYRELVDIADACELPVEFFTADYDRLPEISDDPRRVIALETAAARARSEARRAGTSAETPSLPGADRRP